MSVENGASVAADVLQDTVGAVCVDDSGNVASAVSSGGIILKQPGRLGQVSRPRFTRVYIQTHLSG